VDASEVRGQPAHEGRGKERLQENALGIRHESGGYLKPAAIL
jgi:hypothetical protein